MTTGGTPAAPLGRGGSVADLREHNLVQVLRILARYGPLVRAEIADRSGLQVTALTNLVDDLRRRGLVEEIDTPRPGGRGRPARPVALATGACVLTLECSRNHVEFALGSLRGDVVFRDTATVTGPAGWAWYRPQLEAAVHAGVAEAKRRGLRTLATEFAIPGAVDHAAGRVIRSVLNGWGSIDLRAEVADMLDGTGIGPIPIGVDRSTNYALLAHIGVGDPPDPPVAYVGGRHAVSGGIADHDGIVHGANGLAGEVGHVIIDSGGRACWCGRRGCVETRIGLLAAYSATVGSGVGSEPSFEVLSEDYPRLVEEIARRAEDDDRRTLDGLDDLGRWLGITIDTVAALLNPTVVIVDGYLRRLEPFVAPAMRRYLDAVGTLPSLSDLTVVYPTGDGSDATIPGMVVAGRDAVIARP